MLVLGSAFSGFNLTLQAGLQGLGRPWDVLTAELSGLAVTVPALALLLPAYGIMGAAVASLLSYLTVSLFMLLRLRGQFLSPTGPQGRHSPQPGAAASLVGLDLKQARSEV